METWPRYLQGVFQELAMVAVPLSMISFCSAHSSTLMHSSSHFTPVIRFCFSLHVHILPNMSHKPICASRMTRKFTFSSFSVNPEDPE